MKAKSNELFEDFPQFDSIKKCINDLKVVIHDAIEDEEGDVEHLEMFLGVIENLEEVIRKGKTPDKMNMREKAAFFAHYMLFEDMLASMDEEAFDDDEEGEFLGFADDFDDFDEDDDDDDDDFLDYHDDEEEEEEVIVKPKKVTEVKKAKKPVAKKK